MEGISIMYNNKNYTGRNKGLRQQAEIETDLEAKSTRTEQSLKPTPRNLLSLMHTTAYKHSKVRLPLFVVNGVKSRTEHIRKELSFVNDEDKGGWELNILDAEHIVPQNRFIQPNKNWRDPLKDRLLTEGEVQCFRLHAAAWMRIAETAAYPFGGVILEDDAKLVYSLHETMREKVFPFVYPELYDGIQPPNNQNIDLVYLGGKQMANTRQKGSMPGMIGPLQAAPYMYWAIGYWISREAAYLLTQYIRTYPWDLIPVDEYLPYHYNELPKRLHGCMRGTPANLNAYKLKEEDRCIIPHPTISANSHTENSKCAFNLLVIVFTSDREKSKATIDTYMKLGYRLQIIEIESWDTSKAGGIEKLQALKKMFGEQGHSNRDVILVSDGYDVIPATSPDVVLKKFAQFDSPIVISGEKNLWPVKDDKLMKAFDEYQSEWQKDLIFAYKYPCSGLFIGHASDIAKMLTFAPPDDAREVKKKFDLNLIGIDYPVHRDDQMYMQMATLCQHPVLKNKIRIDGEAYLFMSLGGAIQDVARKESGEFYSKETDCIPAIFHANGIGILDVEEIFAPKETLRPSDRLPKLIEAKVEAKAKVAWEEREKEREKKKEPSGYTFSLHKNAHTNIIDIGDTGILHLPFLSYSDLSYLTSMATHPSYEFKWSPLKGDDVPGDELRIREICQTTHNKLAAMINEHMKSITAKRWYPVDWKPVSDLFFIRYSVDKQPSLRLHNDISYFSGSIRLEKAKEGGRLVFPRQNVNDEDVKNGELLMWPSRITHPHKVTPVTRGSRLSIVVWTKMN